MSDTTSGPVLVTGAGGQLGTALAERFDGSLPLTRSEWDVTQPAPAGVPAPRLVLHAAAWTDVDAAEADPDGAWAANVLGTRNVAALEGPLVSFSSDYVFDGAKRTPYVESDPKGPLSVYGRTKLASESEVTDGWVVRTSWLFGWTGTNFVRTMIRLGRGRPEVSVVEDQVGSPTFVGHLAAAIPAIVDLPRGPYHVAASGECSWADFAEAIFEETGIECRVKRTTTLELGRAATRPAYSVLRSEREGAPTLPHWRDGLRECLRRLANEAGRD